MYASSHTSLTTSLYNTFIPTCYLKVVKDIHWVKSMNDDLQAIQENFTWDIGSCLPDIKPIGSNGYIM